MAQVSATAKSMSDPAASEVSVSAPVAGRCEVRGALTFASARRAYDAGVKAFGASSVEAIEVDCGAVRAADSAGLAVLLAWLAWAHKSGRRLTFVNLPEAITAVARISEVEGLLAQPSAPAHEPTH
jgi:phospholipid transport system transporter-binding protein